MDLTYLRELHFTHDPSTGEVSFAALYEDRRGLGRIRGSGRYHKSNEQPRFDLHAESDSIEQPSNGLFRKFVGVTQRARLKLDARWDFEQMVREAMPAGTTLLPDVENMRAELAALRAALSTAANAQCGCLGSTISEYDEEG